MKEQLTSPPTNSTQEESAESTECDDEVQTYMIMPYAGKQGEKIMSKVYDFDLVDNGKVRHHVRAMGLDEIGSSLPTRRPKM